MAILKIARMGHPILREKAEEVADPTAPEIHRLVRDMIETMADADGTGLAAPQVHVAKRVVVFMVEAARGADEAGGGEGEPAESETGAGESGAGAVPLTVLINPVIEPLTEEQVVGWEACLSVPGMMGAVPRYTAVRYRALTPEGETVDRVARGFHARVVQHECDHLDGILYPMRMPDLALLGFVEEVRKAAAVAAPGEGEEAEETDEPDEPQADDGDADAEAVA